MTTLNKINARKKAETVSTFDFSNLYTKQKQPSVVFPGKGVLKICSKFTENHPCRSAISIKLQSNFIEITLRHGCSSVNLLHIFRAPFPKNTSGGLLLTEIADKALIKILPEIIKFVFKYKTYT